MIDADLISRKAAVSRISDLIVLELRCERIPTWNEVYKALNDLPTIDAVPVVRCKDCAKWDKSTMEHYEDVFSGSGDTAECRMFCDMDTWGEFTDDMRRTDGNWFCADGERKEDA